MDDNYLKSLQETEYSISANYLQYEGFLANLEIEGKREDALTDVGSMYYYSEETSEQFGVICGD